MKRKTISVFTFESKSNKYKVSKRVSKFKIYKLWYLLALFKKHYLRLSGFSNLLNITQQYIIVNATLGSKNLKATRKKLKNLLKM